ncbi:hypothetical protein DL96DRAFT_1808931 [Flagelloscypha sp. PMI_526]|nr:hypothetical protein DL96DRAFT_1808931 [Flagelloscypha sp. PMI_526]
MSVIMYDMEAPGIEGKAWSPNTIKTKYCLNLKDIEFVTVWVKPLRVRSLVKKLGAKPIGKLPNGSDWYTVPVIQDTTTGAIVSESFDIACYLDEKFPDKGPILVHDVEADRLLYHKLQDYIFKDMSAFGLNQTYARFAVGDLEQAEAFRDRWQGVLRRTFESMLPVGPEATEKKWAGIEKGFAWVSEEIEKRHGKGAKYLGGREPCFLDTVVLGRLFWFKTIFGENSEVWERMMKWEDGKWCALFQEFHSCYGRPAAKQILESAGKL